MCNSVVPVDTWVLCQHLLGDDESRGCFRGVFHMLPFVKVPVGRGGTVRVREERVFCFGVVGCILFVGVEKGRLKCLVLFGS
jgi:hypothetical protein